jgi:hypothetical protein
MWLVIVVTEVYLVTDQTDKDESSLPEIKAAPSGVKRKTLTCR